MPSREHRHFIYHLYLALANEGNRTEQAGRQAIKDLLPSLANMVDPVIAASGRFDKLDNALIAQWNEISDNEDAAISANDLNAQLREVAGGETDEPDEADDAAGRDMNDLLRQKASREVAVEDGNDVNAAFRRAAGR